MAEKKPKTIEEKLNAIQSGLKVKKTSYNSFGKYYFRNAESILEALKPFLKEHGCTVTISEICEQIGEHLLMNSIATITDGNESTSANSIVAIDFNQKGMNKPQQFGSASSYAKKYALGNLFLIDDTADPDATNKHGKEKTVVQPKPKVKITKEQMDKAIEFVKNGGSVEAIKGKYSLTKAQEKELTNG